MRAIDLVGQAALVLAAAACNPGGVESRGDGLEGHRDAAMSKLEVSGAAASKLEASGAQAGAQLGASVAWSGARIVAGAPGRSGRDRGAASVFHREGGGWVEEARLSPSDGAPGDRFGASVAAAGDRVIVGAPRRSAQAGADDRAGAVYVFERDDGKWIERARLVADDAAPFDELGTSVAIAGDRVVAGAPLHRGAAVESGAIYVFGIEGGRWRQLAALTAAGAAESEELGVAVDATSDAVAGGAPHSRAEPELGAGAVYVLPLSR